MAPKKPSHREAKKEACRQAIARAAVALFEQKGFEATTMDEIAAAAHVSRPTVFNYFARKEDILLVVVKVLGDRIQTALKEFQGADPLTDPVRALRQVVLAQASAFAEFPETSRAFHLFRMQEGHARRDGKPCAVKDLDPKVKYMQFLTSLIEKAQDRGELRSDFEARELAYHLLIGLFASTMGPWYEGCFPDEPLPSIIERHFDLYIQGMSR